jgi:hypothetical protein
MAVVRLSRGIFSPHCARLLVLWLALVSFGAAAQDAVQSASPAAAPLPRGVRVLEIKGPIAQPLVPKVREALAGAEPDRFPAGAVFLVDSLGGDGLAAMEIGRMIRAAKGHVFVSGKCASACVFLLAAGVVRGVARDRVVGIHRGRISAFLKGIGVVEINTASNPNAVAALEDAHRRTQRYLKEMGVPDALFAAMMAEPSDQFRYLDRQDLLALGLAGMDPAYLAERAPAMASQLGIPEEEFARRTAAVPEKCLEASSPAPDFASCYRRVLQTGA